MRGWCLHKPCAAHYEMMHIVNLDELEAGVRQHKRPCQQRKCYGPWDTARKGVSVKTHKGGGGFLG